MVTQRLLSQLRGSPPVTPIRRPLRVHFCAATVHSGSVTRHAWGLNPNNFASCNASRRGSEQKYCNFSKCRKKIRKNHQKIEKISLWDGRKYEVVNWRCYQCIIQNRAINGWFRCFLHRPLPSSTTASKNNQKKLPKDLKNLSLGYSKI
jgi:hypothetical protein